MTTSAAVREHMDAHHVSVVCFSLSKFLHGCVSLAMLAAAIFDHHGALPVNITAYAHAERRLGQQQPKVPTSSARSERRLEVKVIRQHCCCRT